MFIVCHGHCSFHLPAAFVCKYWELNAKTRQKDALVEGKRPEVSVADQHFSKCPLKSIILCDDDMCYTVLVKA